jgi:deazaflavin-dependent oxidoreductase (nitroreductase family)
MQEMNAFQHDDPLSPRYPPKGNAGPPEFRQPNAVARRFNRLFGFVVGLGFGPMNSYLLEVRGRKSGRIYRTPVHLLAWDGKEFLVAPRGRTQWVRNAEAAGEITLRRGRVRREFRLRAVPNPERGEILKAYLDGFKSTVQRYFPVPAGSPAAAFAPIADCYPAFELLPR